MRDESFSSAEVMKIAGITPRQLSYWIDTGLVPGQGHQGSGIPRRFTQAQVERICWVKGVMDQIEDLRGQLDAVRIPVTPEHRRGAVSAPDWMARSHQLLRRA